MPKTRTRIDTVYQFSELSPMAKQRAIDWYRDLVSQDNDWADYVMEDANTIAKLLGIEIKTHSVPLMNGSRREEPCIWWGLHTQGSGCSFSGVYAYRKNSVKLVTEYAPQDAELSRIARGFKALQAQHRYALTAVIDASARGNYSGATEITVYKGGDEFEDAGLTDSLVGYLRAFMDWIYDGLNKEYDYQTSDEVIAETIEANEYEFMEDGTRAD